MRKDLMIGGLIASLYRLNLYEVGNGLAMALCDHFDAWEKVSDKE